MNWFLNESTTKLTVELRELVENGVNVWDFDYPSYYKDEQKTAFVILSNGTSDLCIPLR